jgi:3-hydroxyacyl-CoA dehydrogenase
MTDVVRLAVDDGIAVITVDNPPVNAISRAVRAGLRDCLRAAFMDDSVRAVVIAAAGRTFMAGADIREFDAPPQDPHLGDVIDALEAGPKPVVAAIHGTALGGGFEVALGCHYRIAAADAKVGLPEVNLGLIPGAGGTQRLPRLVGVEAAIAAIAGGRHIPAREALAIGAVDAIADGDLMVAARAAAERLAAAGTIRRTAACPIPGALPPAEFYAARRAAIARQQRGFPAPLAAVDAVESAATLPFREGIARERALSWALKQGGPSRALRHLFFGEREVARIPGIARETPTRPVATVGVVGAGTMGSGIAATFLNAGFAVVLTDATEAALARGRAAIAKIYDREVEKGRLSTAARAERLGRLATALDLDAHAAADLVIEAAFEDMAVKQDIFRRLDAVCRPGAILASNTSTLDLDRIAEATRRPADVIGTHFFSPAHVMRLLEVVRGAKTADDVIATVMALGRRIGKVAVLSGVCFGFIGNRMFEGYVRESQRLLLEGATPAQVDAALTDFGMAMGPCAVIDLAGVDVSYLTREGNRANLPPDPSYCLIGDKLHRLGRLGRKSGAGFYRYGPNGAESDPAVEALIGAEAERLGIRPRAIAPEEIVRRCLAPLISEGAQILDEGIALRPVDIDVVWCAGYGFPRFRGGPMFHADTQGLRSVVDGMAALAATLGNDYGYWTPAPLLSRLAAADRTFADWTRS